MTTEALSKRTTLERAAAFDWCGDVADSTYYEFVCDVLEAWEEVVTPSHVAMALHTLHTAHDEHLSKSHIELAQHYLNLWFKVSHFNHDVESDSKS